MGCAPAQPTSLSPAVPGPSQSFAPYLDRMIQTQIEEVRRRPSSAESHGTLGVAYEANELWELALASYTNASQLDPGNPSWSFRQALCVQRLGRAEEAERRLQEITTAHPTFAPAWYRRGRASLARGDLDGALRFLEKCSDLVPRDPAAKAAIADCLIRNRKHAEAVALLTPIVAAHPDFEHARFLLGMAYRGLGQREKALAAQKDIVDTGPWDVLDDVDRRLPSYKASLSLVVERALDLIEAGRSDEAARTLEAVLEVHPNEVSVINNLASAYQALKRYPEALSLLNRARDVDPLNFRTYLNQAACFTSMNDYPRALESARDAVSLAPQVAVAHMAVARCLILLREIPEAKATLARVVELDPRQTEAQLALGEFAMAANDFVEARARLTIVNQLEPRHLPSLVNLGLAHLFLGELDQSQARLNQARALQPDHPKVVALALRIEQARKLQP